MRTKEEVKRQVDGLKEMRAAMPHFNFFGDDNWRRIDMQIDILEGRRSYAEHFSNAEVEIESLAYHTNEWLKGESNDDLFEEI